MKNIVLVLLIASVLVACDKEETIIYPTFKKSVEFSINNSDFAVEGVIPATGIQDELKTAVVSNVDEVELKDVWLEVKPQSGNSANIVSVDVTIKTGTDDTELILLEDIIIHVEDGLSIVPLMSVITNEGAQELTRQLSDVVAGVNDNNINLSLKGETFYKDGLEGNVDVDIQMFIRYSF